MKNDFGKILKAKVEEHFSNSGNSNALDKERIWKSIQERKTKTKVRPLKLYWAAASLIFILGIGALLLLWQPNSLNSGEEIVLVSKALPTNVLARKEVKDTAVLQNVSEARVKKEPILAERTESEPSGIQKVAKVAESSSTKIGSIEKEILPLKSPAVVEKQLESENTKNQSLQKPKIVYDSDFTNPAKENQSIYLASKSKNKFRKYIGQNEADYVIISPKEVLATILK